MYISKEEFTELSKTAISCLVTPTCNKYELSDGTMLYRYSDKYLKISNKQDEKDDETEKQ